jgi:tetratricopeptide (TPR) repeat protein
VAARGEAQTDVEVSTLVVPAWRLRWRAPELALVLGERAVALASARRDEVDRLRAESLVIFASNRMGRGLRVADRALDALRAAEAASEHETAWRLRVELAGCAKAVGAPLTGFGAIRPVLEAEGVPDALRAAALVQASDCLVTIGRGPELGYALAEADQLYQADPLLDDDSRTLQRGLLHATSAAQHRRWGDVQAAAEAASLGLDLLGGLSDPTMDSGQVRGKLVLELVCALMDSTKLGEAAEIGSPLLAQPVRAPSASSTGWLRLALATRVHLPAGRIDIARELLREAADSAERHQLDTLLAESLLALAHVHEVSGDLAEALTDLRAAHAAERRRARAVYAVRARLAAEFSGAHRQPVGPHEQLASLLRPRGNLPKAQVVQRHQPPADAVLAPELKQQLRQWRPVQLPKSEGIRVKRTLRAAEDMTVEGISAARAHAADRWRLAQPFGEDAEDATEAPSVPEPSSGGRRRAEDRPAPPEVEEPAEQPIDYSADRAVSAAGLIAAAGAMRSGRRRAAREAAEGEPESGPDTVQETVVEPTSEPVAVQAPVEEAAPAAESEPDVGNVLDNLKAAGLLGTRRTGGRRRAPDADDAPPEPEPTPEPVVEQVPTYDEAPQWRVEPPQRLRAEEEPAAPPAPVEPAPVNYFDAPTARQPMERFGLSAAFVKGPVIPTARVPEPEPVVEPSSTVPPVEEPSPVPPVPPQRPQPPQPEPVVPTPEPEPIPAVPEPDPIPVVPEPDPVPRPPTSSGFDLGPSSFLRSADVEYEAPEPVSPPPAPEVEVAPVVVEPVSDPFVTAVVVGDTTIEVPSSTRASRRQKSDLSLAELLTEALVAYETGRRSDVEAGTSEESPAGDVADWMSSADVFTSAADPKPADPTAVESDPERTGPIKPVAVATSDNETTGPILRVPAEGGEQPPRFTTWTLPE